MRVGRLRLGELVALAGAAGLLVLLFTRWFGPSGDCAGGWTCYAPLAPGESRPSWSGWSTLGWPTDLLLSVVILGGFALAYLTLKRAAPAWPVGASVLTSLVGGVVWLVLLVRLLTLADDTGIEPAVPAYLGLLCAALIPAGAWLAMRDERRHAPESAYTPPPARSVPTV